MTSRVGLSHDRLNPTLGEEGRDVRIGIDMLGIQSPGAAGRDSSRLGRRLVSSLLAHRSGHHFVLYGIERVPTDPANWTRGRGSIPGVIDHNPDDLDWLVLLDPFHCGSRGIAPRAKLDGIKVASVITDLAPGRADDRRLAPLRSHDALLTFSEGTEAECLERLSTPANRVVRIGLGVDETWDGEASSELGAEQLQGLEINGSFLFANLAAGPEDSNLAGILDAYRRLPIDLREAHQLVIAGEVADPWAAVRLLQDHRCAEGLVLAGRVDDPTLRLLYDRCAAFVSPSFSRASALSVIEAMARGAAIVAGRSGSQPGVVEDAGLLADPTDPSEIAAQVARLLSDLDFSQALRRKALVRSRDFPWAEVIDRFLAVLEDEGPARVERSDREIFVAARDEWACRCNAVDAASDDHREAETPEGASFHDGSLAGLRWEDVTIHVLADVFSVRSRRRVLERQPGLVLFRDESSLDRIEYAPWKPLPTLGDVEAEVACSRLREIFATSSRVAVRSSRNLGAIRSRFPEYADQVVLIPPSSNAPERERAWSAAPARSVDAIEFGSKASPHPRGAPVGHRGESHEGSSFPRTPGLTPLPLDV